MGVPWEVEMLGDAARAEGDRCHDVMGKRKTDDDGWMDTFIDEH